MRHPRQARDRVCERHAAGAAAAGRQVRLHLQRLRRPGAWRRGAGSAVWSLAPSCLKPSCRPKKRGCWHAPFPEPEISYTADSSVDAGNHGASGCAWWPELSPVPPPSLLIPAPLVSFWAAVHCSHCSTTPANPILAALPPLWPNSPLAYVKPRSMAPPPVHCPAPPATPLLTPYRRQLLIWQYCQDLLLNCLAPTVKTHVFQPGSQPREGMTGKRRRGYINNDRRQGVWDANGHAAVPCFAGIRAFASSTPLALRSKPEEARSAF